MEEAFQQFLKAKGTIITCTSNLEFDMLTFLLLTVYHLFIWYYIFKDYIG